jgi:hypothetical protein
VSPFPHSDAHTFRGHSGSKMSNARVLPAHDGPSMLSDTGPSYICVPIPAPFGRMSAQMRARLKGNWVGGTRTGPQKPA